LGLLSEMRSNDRQAEEFYLRGYKFALSISPKVTAIVARQWQTAELDNASGKPTNVIQHTFKVPNINYEDEGFFNLCLNLGALYERQNKYKSAVFFTWTASKHAYENNGRRIARPDIHELVRNRMFRIFARLTPDDLSVPGGRLIVRSFIGREYDLGLQNNFLNSLLLYGSNADLTQQTANSLVTLALRFKTDVQDNRLSEDETEPFALRRVLISKARLLDSEEKQRSEKCLEDNTPSTVKEKCRQLYDSYEALSKLVFAQQPGGSSNSFVTRYQELNNQISSLKEAIYPAALSSYIPKSELKDFQDLVPKDAALVEIVKYRPPKAQPKFNDWWDEWHYAAAVFKPNGNPQWVALGKADKIDASVARLRNALADKNAAQRVDVTNAQQASRVVDQQVMAKIRPLLGNAKHLLISADGELNLVPFEALRDETGQYLINRYQFSYLTSGRDLLQIADSRKNPQKHRQNSIILADPDYGELETQRERGSSVPSPPSKKGRSTNNVDTLSFNQLEGTRREAEAIKAEVLPDARLLMDGAATETALKQIQSPNLLLIATHGFFLTNTDKFSAPPSIQSGDGVGSASEVSQQQVLKIENPLLRSGLALAGVNQRNNKDRPARSDDGILTALEVAGLDLRGTQLVVLSACETGVGEAKVGDGVYGLRRALVIAGAQSQVLSLWKVDDNATKDLMVSYFTKMVKEGKGRHGALQETKRDMLKNPKYQHPYYWASFIPSGDWTPLSK